ncbi:MAG: hypothetical protein CO103_02405 [Chloroflexi bacterium CG_4_9_14_3_um_filter_45_9]|nr:MAG: hypothetical protein CO103_02405 [Chloroflexi bacterium CG_4_9_14_3_um_filter_45_9]
MSKRRWLYLVVAAVCLFSLIVVGCAKPAPITPTQPATPTQPTTPPTTPSPEVKPVVLNWADPSAYGTGRTVMQATWGKLLEEKTKGKFRFEWYWAQSLAKALDIYDGVKGGLYPAGINAVFTYHPKTWPIYQLVELPILFGTNGMAHGLVRYEMYHTVPELKAEIEGSGIRPLWHSAYEPTCFMSKVPIEKWEDLKGLRIGTKGPLAEWVKLGGAVPMGITTYEYYEALQKGTVDAVTGYPTTFGAFKLTEVAKYANKSPLQVYCTMGIINPDVYKKLPAEFQQLLDEAWILYQKWTYEAQWEMVDSELERLHKENGLTVLECTPEEYARWREQAQLVWEKYITGLEAQGVDARGILNTYESLYKKYANYTPKQIYERYAELYKKFYGRDLTYLREEILGDKKYLEYKEMLGIK